MTAEFSPLALSILKDRYLWKDKEGKTIESPEQMFRRVAHCVADAEKTGEDKEMYEDIFYDMMSRLEFLPNSPTLMNAGREFPHGQLSACFVIGIEDSMASICEALRKQMLIHKSGGGTGFNFSSLRAKGSRVNSTNGAASGPVSYMRLFDLSTDVVQQGGCFVADTLVATAKGPVKISELKEGTLVYSYLKDRGFILTPCTAPFMTKKNVEVMTLETDKGLKVRATPDHPFMYQCGDNLCDNAYGKLKDLKIDTPLMTFTKHDCKVKSVTPIETRYDVWNVEVPKTHNYVVCDEIGTTGVVVSNTRRGANMAILDADHADIREFIHCKDAEGHITNFNLSVGITDDFMAKAIEFPKGKESQLLHEIASHAWKSGDPGVVFLDAIERDNPTPELGRIVCTNPCGEEPLLSNEACNLGSINLVAMLDRVENMFIFNWNRYIRTIDRATRFLSNVIYINQYPLPEIEEAVKKTRKIGLGIMGYAHMLYYLGISYDSEEAIEMLSMILDTLATRTRHYAAQELSDRPEHKAFTCIAPTGTLSLIAGVSSGIEPVFALSHTREYTDICGVKHTEVIYDPAFKELMELKEESYTEEDKQRIFKTSYSVSPYWHVHTQAVAQKYIDAGISKTVNMPNTASVADVESVYVQAWNEGCKGTTIYRDGSKLSQVLKCPECEL